MDGILHDRISGATPPPRDSSGAAPSSHNSRRRSHRSNDSGISSSSHIVPQHINSGNIAADYNSNIDPQYSSSYKAAQHGSNYTDSPLSDSSIVARRSNSNIAAQHNSSSHIAPQLRNSSNISVEQCRPQQEADDFFFRRLSDASSSASAPRSTSGFSNCHPHPEDKMVGDNDANDGFPRSKSGLGNRNRSTGNLSAVPTTTTVAAATTPPANERTGFLRPVSSLISLSSAFIGLTRRKSESNTSEQGPQLPQMTPASTAASAASAAAAAAAGRAALVDEHEEAAGVADERDGFLRPVSSMPSPTDAFIGSTRSKSESKSEQPGPYFPQMSLAAATAAAGRAALVDEAEETAAAHPANEQTGLLRPASSTPWLSSALVGLVKKNNRSEHPPQLSPSAAAAAAGGGIAALRHEASAEPATSADERNKFLRPVSSMLSLSGALIGSAKKSNKSKQPGPEKNPPAAAAAPAGRAAVQGQPEESAAKPFAAAYRECSRSTEAVPATALLPANRERSRSSVGEVKRDLMDVERGGGERTGRGTSALDGATKRGNGSVRRATAARPRISPFVGGTDVSAAGGSSIAAGFSRRKAPIAPALRYLMEVMCTDLIACGECFVPDDSTGQTLVRFCGFVPIEVDEALDWETSQFVGDDHGEAYGRGVGLPGIAWAAAKARVVNISTLTGDPSFNAGGRRLFQAGRLFHTAMTVPLYSNDGIQLWGVGRTKHLMGVVVVYFPTPENHAPALMTYASSVAASASSMSELMVHRSLFVEGRLNRVNRNWRVMKIAILFAMPMFIKYHQLTGKSIMDVVRVDSMESGKSTTTVVSTASLAPTAFRAPRYNLSIEKSKRSVIEPSGAIPSGAAVVLFRESSRRSLQSEGPMGEGLGAWLVQYAAKAKGGPVHMPARDNRADAFVTWAGTFISIGLVEMIFNLMNGSIRWRGEEDLFVLSGSFGALSTLMFALPAVPFAQPRIIVSAHTLAIALSMIAVSLFEKQQMVWLQKALTAATVIMGMSLFGIVHPPAGALCLVFIGAHNKGASDERMLTLILSVIIGLAVHLLVGIAINNISPRRGYPVFW